MDFAFHKTTGLTVLITHAYIYPWRQVSTSRSTSVPHFSQSAPNLCLRISLVRSLFFLLYSFFEETTFHNLRNIKFRFRSRLDTCVIKQRLVTLTYTRNTRWSWLPKRVSIEWWVGKLPYVEQDLLSNLVSVRLDNMLNQNVAKLCCVQRLCNIYKYILNSRAAYYRL